jgi:tetratricopeptide (TPR) repeat protein
MQINVDQIQQLLSQGKARDAETQLNQIIQSNSSDEYLLSLLGHSQLLQDKLDQANHTFERLTQLFPDSVNAHMELANVYQAKERWNDAEECYRQVLALDSTAYVAWHFLGNLLMQKGDKKEARESFVNAQRCDPFRKDFERVQQALKHNKPHEAEVICRTVLKQHPNHTQALHTLASLAEQVEAYEEAVNILNKALDYAPYHISIWQALAKNLKVLGHFDEAINAGKKLLEMEPENVSFHTSLADIYVNAGQFDNALAIYERALDLLPKDANLHLLRGHVLKTLGRRKDCVEAYYRSLSLEKVNGTAYWSLADLKSHKFNTEDVEAMDALINDSSIPPAQAAQTGFALAKHYEDSGEFSKAFELYQKANALRPNVHFLADEYEQQCHKIKRGFSHSIAFHQAEIDSSAATPIFVVGLTRSGSTLIEQILASHSQVEGTMELYSLPRVVRRAGLISNKKGKPYPEAMEQFTQQELQALGQSYLEETKAFRSDKKFFIDKMPPNFHNVGLIHMILPNALIIDARRYPLSTGLSNFKQHFAGGYDFSYSLENIGHYYNGYLDLMDHWDNVLPNKVLHVQYENLVNHFETQVKRILTYCRLDFENSCLDFYNNKRAVRTASSEQVRQPIYTNGLSHWRNFEDYLTPLKTALGEETMRRVARWEH